MDLIETLEEIGLNRKESEIYLALLKLGDVGASRLAAFTKINRVTVYGILESLKSKGFISSVILDRTTKFVAKEPKEILVLLKQKQDRIEEILPELENINKSVQEKPSVTLFEGEKRVSELVEKVFTKKEGFLSYGNMNTPEKLFENETINLRKKRIQNKVKARSITNKTEHVSVDNKEFNKLSEFRILKEMESLTTWTYIFGNKVAITSLQKEVVGILIENEEFANTQRVIFEMLWKKAKQI